MPIKAGPYRSAGKTPFKCVQLASYLEGDPLMWMMPLHLHVNQKSDYDDDDIHCISFSKVKL